MKKFILIILIIGALIIMLSPVNSIIKNAIGNIIFRGNVVTGIVDVDNGDGSYDVFIAESDVAYPKIFTLSANPDLAVGDKVRILYKNGIKELPIILPPRAATAVTIYRGYVLISGIPDELQLFDMDGIFLNSISVGTGFSYGGCGVTMDSQGNIYIEEDTEVIKKYDKDFNLLVTQNIESASNWIVGINMGNDGFIYTLEGLASGYGVKKRSITDLTIQESIPITADSFKYYDGPLCLDLDNNIYVYNSKDDYIEKYSNAGVLLAQIDVGALNNVFAGCGVCGNYVYFQRSTSDPKFYYMPLDLSSYSEWSPAEMYPYCITVADGYLIVGGWGLPGYYTATAKYDSDRNLVWIKEITDGSNYYKAGGYNF